MILFIKIKAVGFSTYFYSVGRAFEYIREKHGLITCLMAHYGMTLASSLALISLIVIKIREGEIVWKKNIFIPL